MTKYGFVDCKDNLETLPKCVLQSYLHFVGLDCGRQAKKEDICSCMTQFKKIETKIRSKKLKQIPLTEYLKKESSEDCEKRLKGGKMRAKEWEQILEKSKIFLHKN